MDSLHGSSPGHQRRQSDLTALEHMPRTKLEVQAKLDRFESRTARVTLTNKSNHIAFFVRLELRNGMDGEEALPITYDDNYITLLPHTTRTIRVDLRDAQLAMTSPGMRLEGYNVAKMTTALN